MKHMHIAFAVAAMISSAADWPQWLGPNRDGTSSAKIAPWTTAPSVVWRVPVGEGHSSPVVAHGKVYLHDRVAGKEEERITVFNAKTGEREQEHVHPRVPYTGQFGSGPRGTPAVADDGQIVSLGIAGVLSADGKNSWSIDTLKQFNVANLRFGVSASPLIDGDRVIAHVGAKGASLVAFDRKTGSVAWQSQDDAASYAAPIITDHAGKRCLITLTSAGVVALNPSDGSLLWRHPFKDLLQESSATPCRSGELLIVSSVTLGSMALKLTEKDGKPAAEQAWRNPALCCYFSTPVPVGKDNLYMVTGSLTNVMRGQPQADLCCVETTTGKLLWKKEKVGKYHASLVRTGDDKLLMHSDGGELMLLDPNASEYRELSRATICGPTWAHPALADSRLYVRDEKELICIQLGK